MAMRPIGFSTGSLNPRDPADAIEQSLAIGADAVELSALRLSEVEVVAEAAASPRLARFRWVSLHAPSKFERADEREVAKAMTRASAGRLHVVVHPDAIFDPDLWRPLGPRLVLENMDRRKMVGRFAHDFHQLFVRFPEARLCLDLAHVRQMDPSLVEGFRFLRDFADRLVEVHVSEVDTRSRHSPLSMHAESHLREFSKLIPRDCPAIIESVLDGRSASEELRAVRALLQPPERPAVLS